MTFRICSRGCDRAIIRLNPKLGAGYRLPHPPFQVAVREFHSFRTQLRIVFHQPFDKLDVNWDKTRVCNFALDFMKRPSP